MIDKARIKSLNKKMNICISYFLVVNKLHFWHLINHDTTFPQKYHDILFTFQHKKTRAVLYLANEYFERFHKHVLWWIFDGSIHAFKVGIHGKRNHIGGGTAYN